MGLGVGPRVAIAMKSPDADEDPQYITDLERARDCEVD
jgi:hypothetical protein